MKFHELLIKYSNTEIIERLKLNYEDIDNESYISALTELRGLKPSTEIQDVKIIVEFIKDDYDEDNVEIYLSCDGIGLNDKGEMIRWGLDFSEWKDWLAMDIEDDCFNKLSELTILAGIARELTFDGYCEKDVKSRLNKILGREKECEEHPENLVKLDLDELRKQLEGDK